MPEPICEHGMPSPASCVTCMEDGNLPLPPRPAAERVDGRPVGAAFPGQCPACNFPIAIGDLIVRTTRDRWIHEGCAP